MDAEVLTCPNCGGVATRDAIRCAYCQAQLKSAACAHCFSLAFVGTKHCPSCGEPLETGLTQVDPGGERPRCPRCRIALVAVLLRGTLIDECETCGGLWVEQSTWEAIIAQRELAATIHALGAPPPGGHATHAPERPNAATYIPCPRCNKLMNRSNYARISGVLIDSCKGHGTWFDEDELRRIVEFVAAGGLDHARARQKSELDEARRQLEAERRVKEGVAAQRNTGRWSSEVSDEGDLIAAIGAAIHSLFR